MEGRTKNALGLALALAVAMAAIWIAKGLFGEYVLHRTLSPIEVLTLGQLVVLALGLGSVVLLWIQTRNESQWRKLLSYHQYFSECPKSIIRNNMLAVMTKLNHIDHLDGAGTPLHDPDVDAILADRVARQKVVVYLDGFEQLSGAVNAGIVDGGYAYDQDATRLLRIYKIFKPLMTKVRVDSPKAYEQFEYLAEQWIVKRDKELQIKRDSSVKSRAPR